MKKSIRTTALLLVMAMFLTTFLAACSTGNEGGGTAETPDTGATETPGKDAAAETEPPKKNVEIDFWTIALSPNFDDYINGRIAKFEEANPNIKVKWTDLPYNAIENKLLTSIAGGNAPDVVNLNTGMALTLAAKNALVDLNQEAKEEQRSIYFENMLQSGAIDDGLYAFPWYLTMSVFMYNKQIYEEAGLDPNQPPKTWDEVVQQAKQIKQNTGKYAFVYTPNIMASLIELGVPVLNEDRTKVTVNTPEALEYAKWVKSLYDEDVVPQDGLTGGYTYNIDQYQAGQMAMLITGSQFLTRVKDNAPDVYNNTMVAQQPALTENGNIHTPLMNVVVPKLSDSHQESIAFANFITNDESQLEFAKVVNILPSTKVAAEDPFFSQSGDDPESKAKVMTAAQLNRAYDFTFGLKRESDMIKAFTDEWTKMLLGQQSPEDALKIGEENMQKVLDEINSEF
ncbi:sugar ABC transporter substrate-binding protein [Paenibacillus sp.]|uniref:ABC transporter substrate-binding protein n=1 Tax=Paenibacillus sp. TaxID=58172 RepID=UPI0028123645|nr:sugar ABC transporter substrate-binding protein [Paenibacillus sp.]